MNELPLEVDCQTVFARHGKEPALVLLDCREPDEFAVAKIEGALLLPMSQLVARVAELEAHRDAPLVIHCHHGSRSLRVANWLRGQGFSQAQSMAGGIDLWSQQIDPSVPRY